MASVVLPPRKLRQAEEVTIKRNRSSLEVLMQTGFSKQRAEKALAATGDKGVHLASDWLLSHANDPTLDEDVARDYILYLCPVGQLQQQFIEFWKKSYETCGWNRAHNYFPHITLCSFFKASDSALSEMSHLTKTISEQYASQLSQLELEYFSSPNFIGLFVSSEATDFLKSLVNEFSEKVQNLGVQMEAHKKQLHMSLAYQFHAQDKEKLETQIQGIKLDLPVRWDLRLYSRDPRISNCQVRKVLFAHEPRYEDELKLITNDFTYVPDEELKTSPDGWGRGISWLSGVSGMFPVSYTQRVAETETWTMHRSIPIIGTDIGIRIEEEPGQNGPIEFDNPVYHEGGRKSAVGGPVVGPDNVLHFPASPKRSKKITTQPNSTQPNTQSENESKSDDEEEPAPKLPPSRHSFKEVKKPPLLQPVESNSSPQTSQSAGNQANTTTNQSNSTTSPSQPNRPSQSKPAGNGPPLLVPRRDIKLTPKAGNNSANTSTNTSSPSQSSQPAGNKQSATGNKQSTQSSQSQKSSHTNLVGSATMPANPSRAAAKAASPKKPAGVPSTGSASAASGGTRTRGPRQLYVVRHGERIDFTFGKDWISNSFDSAGHYFRYDLNMPKTLPKRRGGPKSYDKDSPLTTQGHFQASLVGSALKDVDVPISHVYASPSLRCVQTANEILKGLGIRRPIRVEPGLFEWLGWYRNGMPSFMTREELIECGLPVDPMYDPVWPEKRFNMDEKAENYYDRCHEVTKTVLQSHESEGGNILFVAHKGSVDTCTLQLRGKQKRPYKTFHRLVQNVPYCGFGAVEENGRTWKLVAPPIPAFTRDSGKTYDWSIWL